MKLFRFSTKRIITLLVSLFLISSLLSGCTSQIEEAINGIFGESVSVELPTLPAAENENRQIQLFGYNNISNEKSKAIYEALTTTADSLEPQEAECGFAATEMEISEAYFAYKNDHPEAFWLKNSFEYYSKDSYVSVTPEYTVSGKKLKTAKEKFNARVEEIISKAPADPSEYEVELFVNDYLVSNCAYDSESAENKNVSGYENDAYGAIVEGKAVCEGYARAFQLLCNRLNVNCVNVIGYAEESHQWNCVLLGGEWYNVDVTWNDSDSSDEYKNNFYLNLTDEEFSQTHSASPVFSEITEEEYNQSECGFNIFVPSCNSEEYSYRRLTCAQLENLDEADLIVAMLAARAKEGKSFLNVTVEKNLDFEETVDSVLYENYLYKWFDRANKINKNTPKISCKQGIYVLEKDKMFTIIIDYE